MDNVIAFLKSERQKIDAAIQALEGSSTTTRVVRRRRTMSQEARDRISRRMKARWAERKRAAKKAA